MAVVKVGTSGTVPAALLRVSTSVSPLPSAALRMPLMRGVVSAVLLLATATLASSKMPPMLMLCVGIVASMVTPAVALAGP